ncbi:MAG: hypothetical protein WBR18_13035 [Anaerolineales bacterium]
MTKKMTWLAILLAVMIGLSFWAPWLTGARAEQRAASAFQASWAGVIDGCGLSCNGCGAVESHWLPFGYSVTLEYACGLIPADTAEYHQRSSGYVPLIGPVTGFPGP